MFHFLFTVASLAQGSISDFCCLVGTGLPATLAATCQSIVDLFASTK